MQIWGCVSQCSTQAFKDYFAGTSKGKFTLLSGDNHTEDQERGIGKGTCRDT